MMMCWVTGSAFKRRVNSMPSITGIWMSIRISSGAKTGICSNAWLASGALSTR